MWRTFAEVQLRDQDAQDAHLRHGQHRAALAPTLAGSRFTHHPTARELGAHPHTALRLGSGPSAVSYETKASGAVTPAASTREQRVAVAAEGRGEQAVRLGCSGIVRRALVLHAPVMLPRMRPTKAVRYGRACGRGIAVRYTAYGGGACGRVKSAAAKSPVEPASRWAR